MRVHHSHFFLQLCTKPKRRYREMYLCMLTAHILYASFCFLFGAVCLYGAMCMCICIWTRGSNLHEIFEYLSLSDCVAVMFKHKCTCHMLMSVWAVNSCRAHTYFWGTASSLMVKLPGCNHFTASFPPVMTCSALTNSCKLYLISENQEKSYGVFHISCDSFTWKPNTGTETRVNCKSNICLYSPANVTRLLCELSRLTVSIGN